MTPDCRNFSSWECRSPRAIAIAVIQSERVMRIRKGRLARGNASSAAHMMDTVSSSRGRKLHDYSGAMEQQSYRNVTVAEPEGIAKAPLDLLERLQISPPERPYMNLDEFVTSLARKNCFPADDACQDYSDDHSSCGLINNEYCSVQSTSGNDEESPDFSRLYGGNEDLRGDIAAVETSLRLSSGPAHKPAHPRTTTLVSTSCTSCVLVTSCRPN